MVVREYAETVSVLISVWGAGKGDEQKVCFETVEAATLE